MNVYEARLVETRAALADAFVSALENGVPLATCLDLLGVEGKAATLLRAMLSRYNEAQLAEMLSGLKAEITPSGDRAESAEARY